MSRRWGWQISVWVGLAVVASLSGQLFAACGDWLDHPPGGLLAARLFSSAAEQAGTPSSRLFRPGELPRRSQVPQCRGPHCGKIPLPTLPWHSWFSLSSDHWLWTATGEPNSGKGSGWLICWFAPVTPLDGYPSRIERPPRSAFVGG